MTSTSTPSGSQCYGSDCQVLDQSSCTGSSGDGSSSTPSSGGGNSTSSTPGDSDFSAGGGGGSDTFASLEQEFEQEAAADGDPFTFSDGGS